MTSFPSFSKPLTRADYDKVILQLTNHFTKQNLPDPRTLAALVVNLRDQGLSDVQIQKQIDQHLATQKAKADAKAAQVAKLQAAQKPLLDKLSAAKTAKQTIIDAQNAEREQAVKEFIYGKPSNEMLADPRDPSKKITRAEYDKVIAERAAQNKDTTNKTGNPNTDAIRAQIQAEKAGISNPVVIGVNRSYVQLSNGQLIERSKFTGTIPAELLAKANTTEQFPTSFNSQTDLSASKNTSPVKSNNSSVTKPKADTGKFSSNSAFAPKEPTKPEDTLGGFLKNVGDALSNAVNPPKEEKPQEQPKQEASFDPLKAISDAINGGIKAITDLATGAGKTIVDAAATVTQPPKQDKPAATPQEKPNASDTEKVPVPPYKPVDPTDPNVHIDLIPKEPEEKSILTKVKDFAEKNSIAIVASVAAVSFLSALAFTIPQARKAVMEK